MLARQALRDSKYLMMRALASDWVDPYTPRRGPEWATDFVISRRDAEKDSVRKETLQGMLDDGFQIVKNAIPKHMVADLLHASDRFRENKTVSPDLDDGDGKRHRYRLSHDQKSGQFDIWSRCHALMSTFFCPHYLVVDTSFLYSDAGCVQQPAHRNFLSDVHRWGCDFPISALVALEEDTRCVAFDSKRRWNGINETDDDLRGLVTPRHISLSPGSMMIWHGNLVHASAACPYQPNNSLVFSAVAPDDALSIPLDHAFPVSV